MGWLRLSVCFRCLRISCPSPKPLPLVQPLLLLSNPLRLQGYTPGFGSPVSWALLAGLQPTLPAPTRSVVSVGTPENRPAAELHGIDT